MKNSNTKAQEGIDKLFIEDINQLEHIAIGEGAETCHVCDEPVQEGDSVAVYVSRVISTIPYTVGPIFCQEHKTTAEMTCFRDRRELIVGGRVGTVSDAAMQSTYSVLLAPEVELVSPIGSREAYTQGEYAALRAQSLRADGSHQMSVSGIDEQAHETQTAHPDSRGMHCEIPSPAIEQGMASNTDPAVEQTVPDGNDGDDVIGGDAA